MKKILLLLCIVGVSSTAYAQLTQNDAVSRDYLINHGYSEANVNAIQKSIARSSGEPLAEPEKYEAYKNPCVKFVRRFFMYIDPSLDDHSFASDRSIKTSPSYTDL